jgi:putative spermidine/putrescine transport system substrate-binding protein
MEELGGGSRTMVASTMGWDMNPRVLGTVPKGFEAVILDDTTLVADGHYAVIPKALDEQILDVSLDLISFILKPEQQARTYDDAYFYPGPAVKDVTLDMAPQESQKAVNSVKRPEFDQAIKDLPVEVQLDATSLVRAFEIWDERIGGSKIREDLT